MFGKIMKILHILYDGIGNPWFEGGGAIRNQEIYRRMAKSHEVTILTGAYPSSEREAVIDGVRYIRIGKGKTAWQSLLSYSSNVFWYKDYKGYDLMIKDLLPVCPVYTPFLDPRVPVIASIQNLEYYFFKTYGILGILPWLNHELSIRMYKHYLLTANSMHEMLKGKIHGDARIAVIPYGVDDGLFNVVPSDENYILYLGRFDIFHKGLDILLEAFRIVCKKFPEVKLIFAGGGREDEKLKKLIGELSLAKKVSFAGRVHGEQKGDLLGRCLMVCMPSRFESWGIVAVEAGACGKPVIGTRIPGLIDSIKDGETGILVPSEKPDLLAEAIINLIKNETERKRLGCNGRLWARNFNWDRLAQEQENFYADVVKAY